MKKLTLNREVIQSLTDNEMRSIDGAGKRTQIFCPSYIPCTFSDPNYNCTIPCTDNPCIPA